MQTSYQVIARRWRPKQFEELVGQEHIVRTLKNAIDQNRIAHAYLLVGPRGTGKTSTARLFAQALNCENGPSVDIPKDSEICQAILTGSCMDVIEIDGASNNSVDQVRQLRDDCQYSPTQCRFKIYIIDEVHMLSNQAFNALLKTLEEPPAHVKFIFATTEAHKVIPTIVSRCQRFEFRPISNDVIVDKLRLIADSEKVTISDEALFSIARLANGGMRDAQSTFDQMISFCGETITQEDILNVYGLAGPEQIREIAQSITEANYKNLLSYVNNLADEGRDLYRILVDLQSFFRQVLIDQIQDKKSKLLDYHMSSESLMRVLDVLHSGETSVQRGLSGKVNFEITLLKAVEQSRSRAIDTLIKEITGITSKLPASGDKKKITESHQKVSNQSRDEESVKLGEEKSDLQNDSNSALTENNNSADKNSISTNKNLELNNLVAKIPESTKNVLTELMHGKFCEVKVFDKNSLV